MKQTILWYMFLHLCSNVVTWVLVDEKLQEKHKGCANRGNNKQQKRDSRLQSTAQEKDRENILVLSFAVSTWEGPKCSHPFRIIWIQVSAYRDLASVSGINFSLNAVPACRSLLASTTRRHYWFSPTGLLVPIQVVVERTGALGCISRKCGCSTHGSRACMLKLIRCTRCRTLANRWRYGPICSTSNKWCWYSVTEVNNQEKHTCHRSAVQPHCRLAQL